MKLIRVALGVSILALLATLCWGGVPTVIFKSPRAGAISISPTTSIDVYFTEAVDTSTINGSTFYLTPPVELKYPAPSQSLKDVSIRPKNSLANFTQYTVHMTPGVQSNADHQGLPSSYTWSFFVGSIIGATTPTSNQDPVSLTSTVTVNFNTDMNESTITSSSFTVKDTQTSQNIPGNVTYVNRAATFRPTSLLVAGRVYTASILPAVKTVFDAGYDTPYSWNFTARDTTPEVAVATSPDKDAENVPVSAKVTAYFNQEMDVSTINGSSFTLNWHGTPVEGSVTYDSESKAAVFTPRASLEPGKTYTATVSAGVKNLTGRILAAPYSWDFTTAAMSIALSTLPDKAVTTKEVLNVSGVAAVNAGLKMLLVNGDEVPVHPDGTFSTALVLAPGTNPITVTATDSGGGTASETRNITYDKTYPSLILASPPDNSATSRSFIDVTGTADATANVIVKDNAGNAYSASRNGTSFSATVNLDWAINTVLILASDTAGKTTSAKRTITYNSSAPGLSIGTPPEDMKTSDTSVTIKGTVAGAASSPTLTLSIDGDQVDPPPALSSGEFQHTITFTKEKTYAITATVTDQQGNSATAQRNIIYAKYDLGDAQKALNVAAGLTAPTPELLARYDVAPFRNGQPVPDGKIDIVDVVVILKRIVGLLAW